MCSIMEFPLIRSLIDKALNERYLFLDEMQLRQYQFGITNADELVAALVDKLRKNASFRDRLRKYLAYYVDKPMYVQCFKLQSKLTYLMEFESEGLPTRDDFVWLEAYITYATQITEFGNVLNDLKQLRLKMEERSKDNGVVLDRSSE